MFCDVCCKNVISGYETRVRRVPIRGITIPVQYKANVCGFCGTELFDDDIEEQIMRNAKEQFRRSKNLLPANVLKAYMKKHDLTPAQMAEKTNCAVGEIIAASKGVLLDPIADSKIKKGISA